MTASDVFEFIAELGRCSYSPDCPIAQFTYNGISIQQSTETYEAMLQSKFTMFKAAVFDMDEKRQRMILEELKKVEQQYFDVPDDDTLAAMLRDYERSGSLALREDIAKARFAHDMNLIQKRFIADSIHFINLSDSDDKTPPNPKMKYPANEQPPKGIEPQSSPLKESESGNKVISGTVGLAKHLGCGKSMATAIINGGKLKKAGIQYKVGNCWKFNAKKLTEYLEDNPEILAKIRCRKDKIG